MSTQNLHRKIDELPADAAAEVEDFVEFILTRRAGAHATASPNARVPDTLLRRIAERRERLLREHGAFSDSTPIVRELRDSGT